MTGAGAGLLAGLLALGACTSIGPTVIPRDRSDYLSSVAESWKEQTLLNVVRIRYGDAPSFMDISSIVSSYAVQGQLNATGIASSNLTNTIPWSTGTVGAGFAFQDRPTISYTPLAGDKFSKSLLRPIPPTGIFQLIQAGYAADFVLQVTVRSLNGIRNRGASGGQSLVADPEFYQLIDAMRRLQLSQAVSLRLEKRGADDVGILVMSPNLSAQVQQDIDFLMRTLHVKPGRNGEISIVFGAVQKNPNELAVLSRSMSEILVDLAGGIDVPPEHIAARRTPASVRVASADNARERPLVAILSGPAAPADAFCAVHYRDTWYWISDNDFPSKRVFTGLMIFFSLAETGTTPQVPSLTIPVN